MKSEIHGGLQSLHRSLETVTLSLIPVAWPQRSPSSLPDLHLSPGIPNLQSRKGGAAGQIRLLASASLCKCLALFRYSCPAANRKVKTSVLETIDSILKTKGRAVWSITPDTSVYDAIALMAEKGIGALLVLSGSKLVGIISERDYARKVILQGRSSRGTRVQEIMTRDLVTVTGDDTVDECMMIMTNHRIRHLPVLSGRDLVGIVSIGDLVSAVIANQAHTIDQLHMYIAGGKYPV